MEKQEQYEKNLKEIEEHVFMMNLLKDALSQESKNTFAERVKQDKELMLDLIEKRKMSVETQERFLTYLRELFNEVVGNA